MSFENETSEPTKSEPLYGPNEIDFDDEREEDQYPLDVIEAEEVGVLLDDPEQLAEGS